MSTVTSADGTTIAFDREGDGPALIIGGGPTNRSAQAPLVLLPASRFTVYNYDRRARGQSGDTAPHATSREYEDLEAVIDAAGGTRPCWQSTSPPDPDDQTRPATVRRPR